jgi:RNA recognition motif-containing protein
MSFTVFLGNLPVWVTSDDIMSWLSAENLVADSIKVIRNPETQESKGFAFIEAPNQEEMQAIIRRFDRAPLEDRLLRANPAQPPRGKQPVAGGGRPMMGSAPQQQQPPAGGFADRHNRPPDRRRKRTGPPSDARRGKGNAGGPQSAFAEELAKVL